MTISDELMSTAEFIGPGNTLKLEPPPEVPINPAAIESGMVIKHYELIRKLGAGGMGTVFLARDVRLGRLVAIKFLIERSTAAVERFVVEARTTALCRHDNIVVIYDVDEISGRPYMALEFVEGRTLRDAMATGARDTAAMAMAWMLPVARALDCAHRMGIVHRDLKPENILLSDSGQIKVLDFGIAKQMTREEAKNITTQRTMQAAKVGLTQDDAIVGTIPYMSPEQWLEQPIDGRCDIWAVGIILFELATGAHPLEPLSAEELFSVSNLDSPMPSAHDKLPGAAGLADVIDRCLKKRREERFASAAELADALEKLNTHHHPKAISDDENPFAGLSAFQEADADRFFGRDDDITAVVGRLRQQQLLTIAGASGAGKSSFVRAGVIPTLKRANKELEVFVIRPGRQPFAALADVLAFFLDTAGNAEESDAAAIATTLRTQPGYLGARLRARCRKRGADHRILLFVDQLEELYTQGIDTEERAAFCACLEGVADDASSPLRVVMTIRADFLDRISEDRRFLAAMTRGLVFLPAMSSRGLREALEKPLEAAGYRFEDEELGNQMLVGLVGTKSPLPLLQFTATKLWEARDREQKLLTRAAYQALGGVAGALSTHADAVLAGMSVGEQRLARAIFLRLVTPERTRAMVRLDELGTLSEDVSAVEHVVQLLAEARLLAIEAGGDREGKTVELTHESLIERWAKLKSWLDENEKDAVFLAELRNASTQWEKNGQAEGFLWRDRAAIEAGLWFDRRKAEVGAEGSLGIGTRELGYLEAVVGLTERTKRRRRQIVGGLFAAMTGIAVVVGWLAIAARAEARRADTQTREAAAQAKRADEQAQRAEEQATAAQEEARQARNLTRVAAGREFREKDPTTALAILREVEAGSMPKEWGSLALQTRSTGVAERVFRFEGEIAHAGWNPDGKRLIAACWDKTLRVWNADGTGTPLVLARNDTNLTSAQWSRDGQRMVAAARDKTLRVWNTDGTGQPLVLRGHDDHITTVAFDPNGTRIVSASQDKTVRIWNTDGTGQPLVLRGHDRGVYGAAWSPDGERVVSGSWDKTVRLWNANGEGTPLVLRGHDGDVFTAGWSPNGKRIVSGAADQTVRLWNADGTGTPLVLQGHSSVVNAAEFSPDGQRIVSVSWDNTLRVWHAEGTRRPLVLLGHHGSVGSASFDPLSRRIVFASDNAVWIWNVARPELALSLYGHDERVSMAAWSPDGKRIATASADKTVRVWSADGSGQALVMKGHEKPVRTVVFSPDGKRIATASEDNTVRVWNADGTGESIVFRGHDAVVGQAVWSPDGKRIASGSFDTTVQVWNVDGTDKPIILRHDMVVFGSAWSPDGKRIAAATFRQVNLWNADGTGEPIIFKGHSKILEYVAFSPDGSHIVSTSQDRTVRIWNTDGTGQPIILQGHDDSVHTAAFSPDGKRIVSASADKTVRIWNADGTGEPIVLQGLAPFYSAAFSPDGKRIVAASDDKTITIFNDLEPFQGPDDPRLWSATAYCMPLDVRQRLLGFSEEQSRKDLAHCEERVAKSFGGTSQAH